MRAWEVMSRASLGILNHLDWFMSSVWTVWNGCLIEKDRQADIDKLMSASRMAVNQLAYIQMRTPICSVADVQKHYVWHRNKIRTAFCSRRQQGPPKIGVRTRCWTIPNSSAFTTQQAEGRIYLIPTCGG